MRSLYEVLEFVFLINILIIMKYSDAILYRVTQEKYSYDLKKNFKRIIVYTIVICPIILVNIKKSNITNQRILMILSM